jgi:hypothetical protein
MDGLLGLDALSILTSFYGFAILYKTNKNSIFSFVGL